MKCDVSDDAIARYADGGEEHLADHVMGCEICQTRLANIWDGRPATLAEGTMRAVRMDAFAKEVAEMSANFLGDLGRAVIALGFGTQRKEPST